MILTQSMSSSPEVTTAKVFPISSCKKPCSDWNSIGGTSGCIIASRLSDADPSLSILLIEAGSNNHGDPTVTTPFLFVSHLAPGSKTVTVLKGNKSEFLGDREPVVQTARMLGGGSSVNMLMYSRAQRSDFDAWQTPGWSSDDLLPYMRKVNDFIHKKS